MSRKKVKICDNKQLPGVDIRQRFDYSKWESIGYHKVSLLPI